MRGAVEMLPPPEHLLARRGPRIAGSLPFPMARSRRGRRVITGAKQRRAHEQVRDVIWNYYQQLKAYREHPRQREQRRLDRKFDRLFL